MQADRHTPRLPSAERDKEDPELAAVLRQVSNKIILSKFSLYHCVVCIASDRLGSMRPVTTELHFDISSLHHCLRVMPMPCIAAGLNQQ